MSYVFFKDRFLPEEECRVSIHDRSFRFGDGIFETLLVYNSRIYRFPHHLERLKNGLSAAKIALDISLLEKLCHELIAKNTLKEGYLRIVVSRGENGPGAIGYLPKDAKPYFLIQSMEKPYPAFREINLWRSSQVASQHSPSKTNNALLYTLAMMEAEEQGCDNALLLNHEGIITETASGNLFWVKDGVLFTPSRDLPLVPGTMRRRVLELWDGAKQEGHFSLEALQLADEIFMTNIGHIVASVTEIRPLNLTFKTGQRTRELRKLLDQDIFIACA